MPKRPLPPDSPETPAILEAIKLARQNGKQLTEQEVKEFAAFRSQSNISKLPNAINMPRRGQNVFRIIGKAGADLQIHPESWKQKKAQRDIEAVISKALRRAPDSSQGVTARQKSSDELQRKVVKLAKKYEHLGRYMASKIADELNITAKHVRVILKKCEPDAKSPI